MVTATPIIVVFFLYCWFGAESTPADEKVVCKDVKPRLYHHEKKRSQHMLKAIFLKRLIGISYPHFPF